MILNLPQSEVLASLSWIDLTALAIVLVFFVLGIFRGFVWQFSRILTLVLAYFAAGRWGNPIAARIDAWFTEGVDPRLPLYIAYFGVFVVALVLVSLLTLLLQKLVYSTGLSFYNRLGGGVLGLGTGACVVLALLAAVLMFFANGSEVVQAAQSSKSMELSQRALDVLGDLVPAEVREVFGMAAPPEAPPGTGAGTGTGSGR
ncbi:MAG: CvpA family protein [Planctomycetota bacterium]